LRETGVCSERIAFKEPEDLARHVEERDVLIAPRVPLEPEAFIEGCGGGDVDDAEGHK
jgi:hypothetical protein